jgi:hypothetical protein
MTLTFWSWISFWTNTNVVVVVYQTPSIIKTRGTRTCWNCKKNMHIQELIFIFAIYVRLKSMYGLRSVFSPQICVFQQIYVLWNQCTPKSVSFYCSDLCPLESLLTQICVLPNRFSLRSVSFTLAEKWRHNNIRWRCFPRLRKHCIPLLLERI